MTEIGVLDLQGGVAEHLNHFRRAGIDARLVKRAEELSGLAGLVIPGGESTALARLIEVAGLDSAIRAAYDNGIKLWGTCAGAILLAKAVEGGTPHLALMDVTVSRNAFGTQLDSFTRKARVPGIADEPLPLIFIRAPKILRAGSDVETLLELEGYIAAAEDDHCLITAFHPELTPSLAFHRYFARKCGLETDGEAASPDEAWVPTSWMRRPA